MSITFRAMQNPDEPDLPFSQLSSPTMFRDMQNPDEPDLPFSQSSRPTGKYVYYEYIVNGDSWVYGKKVNQKVILRETTAIQWRMYGYTVEKVSQTPLDASGNPTGTTGTSSGGTTSNGYPKSYIDEHFDRLYKIHKEQEGRITDAFEHRKSIEGKVETNIGAFPDIHTKLTNLGKSVTDVSNSLNLHAVHPILPPIPPIPPIIPTSVILIVVGVGAYFLLRRKRK